MEITDIKGAIKLNRSKEKTPGVSKQTNAVLSAMTFVFIAFVLIFF